MRKKIVAANWKMNLGLTEAKDLADQLRGADYEGNCEIVLIPSSVYLLEVKKIISGSKLKLGAQNCSNRENGALTGEISAAQLASAGAEFVIIGHSERREYFGETNELVREKMQQALNYKLKPIFCCGESLQLRNENLHREFIIRQLEECLFPFPAEELANVVIAYEPVWAIGTGKTATPDQAQEMHAFIRSLIERKYAYKASGEMRIIYGGSCNRVNAEGLFKCADVDGGLIGTASLNADDFHAIVQAATSAASA